MFGNGGLARRVPSLLEDLKAAGDGYELVGYLDRNDERSQDDCGVIGDDRKIAEVDACYIIAIGDPAARRRIDKLASGYRREAAAVVHPRAHCESPTTISAGCMVLAGAVVQAQAVLGRHVQVGNCAIVGHDVVVGPYTNVCAGSAIGGGARIGAEVFVGVGAIIMPGRVVEDGAVVGAGAVVNHDVAAGTTVLGVPARPR